VIGDGTECHSGMDATRNSVYRNMPGVKVILDNSWAGMTGGQPSPTSPENLAGQRMRFNLAESLRAHGANVITADAYERKALRQALKTALDGAAKGEFTTIVVGDGMCVQKAPASSQRVMVAAESCKKCNACLVCAGIELDAQGIPAVNNLCSGCGGSTPACIQNCPTGVLKAVDLKELHLPAIPAFAIPAQEIELPDIRTLEFPARISLAIRGVGGQGNLFFGSVMSKLALLAGYDDSNIIKGETHGMAQMGGPVISTFGCGEVTSPVLLPGTADCLIAMEKSELLRPGFLEMLRPGGIVLLANTKIMPHGLPEEDYPRDKEIRANLGGFHVIEVDVLTKAFELGDRSGRSANVVMMGLMSTLPPFDMFPLELWLAALKKANPKPGMWAANFVAFHTGREIEKPQELMTAQDMWS
jgi:indolepyruvate ferredoxin oxidoreductase alpha subunit